VWVIEPLAEIAAEKSEIAIQTQVPQYISGVDAAGIIKLETPALIPQRKQKLRLHIVLGGIARVGHPQMCETNVRNQDRRQHPEVEEVGCDSCCCNAPTLEPLCGSRRDGDGCASVDSGCFDNLAGNRLTTRRHQCESVCPSMRTGISWGEVIVTRKDRRRIGTGEMDATVDDLIWLALI